MNIGKSIQKGKAKAEPPLSQRSKIDKDTNDGSETGNVLEDGGKFIILIGKVPFLFYN